MNGKAFHESIMTLLDIVFCALIVYFACFLISFIQMAVDKEKKKVESHAEITMTITWPNEFKDDVDTYVEDPSGRILSFSGQDVGLMALDRDDRGWMSDYFENDLQYEENREIVTIRGTEKGEYVVNVQMFHKESKKSTPVKVTIEKMNPRVSLIKQKTVFLEVTGSEITICRFTVDKDGEISNVNEKPKELAKQNAASQYGNAYPLPPGYEEGEESYEYEYDPEENE